MGGGKPGPKQRSKTAPWQSLHAVTMTSTYTHKGSTFLYKARQICADSWSHIRSPLPTILLVVGLHGQKIMKALWKSRSVDITQWRQ